MSWKAPDRMSARSASSGLSAGVSYYPQDGGNAEELLAIADSRMYAVKRQHHGERAGAQDMLHLARALAETPGELESAAVGPIQAS